MNKSMGVDGHVFLYLQMPMMGYGGQPAMQPGMMVC